jgi:hypothetical protein
MEALKMKDLRRKECIKGQILFIATLGLIALSISSCASLYTERENSFDIARISAAEKTNGFVVTISATKQIGKVEAWIGNDNWLYITIPDTNVNLAQIASLEKNPLFVKTECLKMDEVVQLSLQMREKVDQLNVVRYPDDNNVYVALYRFKS